MKMPDKLKDSIPEIIEMYETNPVSKKDMCFTLDVGETTLDKAVKYLHQEGLIKNLRVKNRKVLTVRTHKGSCYKEFESETEESIKKRVKKMIKHGWSFEEIRKDLIMNKRRLKKIYEEITGNKIRIKEN
jgi:DNA-binding transcriptional regulator YhcF (GntR family)